MSDIFREVDEDVRHEYFKQLWRRYGPYVIGIVVIVVGGLSGYTAWEWYTKQQREEQTARFEAAMDLKEAGEPEQAIEAFADIVRASESGLATMARMQEAALLAEQGQRESAVSIYESIAADPALSESWRQLAHLKIVMVRADDAPVEDLLARLEPLTAEGAPWRLTALEQKAIVLFRAGDMPQSSAVFNAIAEDPAAPETLRNRARDMITVIGPQATAEELAAQQKAAATEESQEEVEE